MRISCTTVPGILRVIKQGISRSLEIIFLILFANNIREGLSLAVILVKLIILTVKISLKTLVIVINGKRRFLEYGHAVISQVWRLMSFAHSVIHHWIKVIWKCIVEWCTHSVKFSLRILTCIYGILGIIYSIFLVISLLIVFEKIFREMATCIVFGYWPYYPLIDSPTYK